MNKLGSSKSTQGFASAFQSICGFSLFLMLAVGCGTPGGLRIAPTDTPTVFLPPLVAISPTFAALQPTVMPSLVVSATTSPSFFHFSKRLLVEVRQIPPSECPHAEIWAIAPPYTTPQPFLQDKLITYRSAHWAHNGKQIAYIEETSNHTTWIGLASEDGGDTQPLTPSYPFIGDETFCKSNLEFDAWSTSDEWIAFHHNNWEGFFDPAKKSFTYLYVTNVKSGQTVVVAKDLLAYPPAIWSPDENTLAYVTVAMADNGVTVKHIGLNLAEVQDNGSLQIKELVVPEVLGIDGHTVMIRGLVWQSKNQLLVAVTPGNVGDPATLYEVDITSDIWQPVAKYRRDPTKEKYEPSEIHLSADGTRLAWVGTDILLLDTSNWEETARVPSNWLGNPLVSWVADSDGKTTLVFSNDNAFWVYDPISNNRAKSALIAESAFARESGIILQSADWEP